MDEMSWPSTVTEADLTLCSTAGPIRPRHGEDRWSDLPLMLAGSRRSTGDDADARCSDADAHNTNRDNKALVVKDVMHTINASVCSMARGA
jgi:hypothetical protein